MAKTKSGKREPINSGTAGMEETAQHLQRAIGAVNAAAFYFESLGMDSQRGQLDSALDEIEGVLELMGVLLGRELDVPFSAAA